jgi:DNA-binding response OmpR family regulator
VSSGQRIVVVGGLAETEQVLKAVLEPRGLQVERIRDREFSDDRASVAPPRIVVLHHDDPPSERAVRVRVARWEDVPHVIIGSAEFAEPAVDGNGQFLPKPFHYRELIGAIEQLLSEPERRLRAA